METGTDEDDRTIVSSYRPLVIYSSAFSNIMTNYSYREQLLFFEIASNNICLASIY